MERQRQRKNPMEKRRAAIMEAAWPLFIEKGYSEVSLDEIIRRSGGSKSTIYDLFGSKEGLFLKLVKSVTDDVLNEIRIPDTSTRTPREALMRIGLGLGSQVLSARAVELYRLAVSESGRFPRVARLFYDSGPRQAFIELAAYLEKEALSGRLRIKDPMQASEFFLGMIVGVDHLSMSLYCSEVPSRKRLKAIVSGAVDVFLSAYGN